LTTAHTDVAQTTICLANDMALLYAGVYLQPGDDMTQSYSTTQPERSDVDQLPGTVALDFGTNWCGVCQGAAADIAAALAVAPQVRHMKVEDGPGRPLGRSFRVKLWPTIIVLKDGVEVARVVRPASSQAVIDALAVAA
jgi:thioredoxin 1